jgi:alpha-tubulin suppressor-like RCC1 family protein
VRALAALVLVASTAGCTLEFDRALLERSQGQGCTDGVNHFPGNAPEACGRSGGPCAQCATPLSACEAGACVVPNAVVAVALGEAHSSALDRNGALWLWGANRAGAVGKPADVVEQRLPAALSVSGVTWSAAAMGGRIPELHSCAIAEPGELYCWGSNGDGQTGLGSAAQPGPVATRVGTASDWSAISAGVAYSCGIRAPGALYCWGYGGDSNRLGLEPEPSDTTTPQRLPGAEDWVSLSTSRGHGCAIKGDLSLWCWGENQFGQLGHTAGNAPPVQVKSGTSYRQVSAGEAHTCGIRDNETLWCWGDNSSGQLGLPGSAAEPTRVGAASDWARVTAGGRHTCGLRSDRTLWCWGSGEYGQVGSGSFADAPEPAPVEGNDWTHVGAGVDHTCAVKLDGTLWCWGANYVGQLGTRGPGFDPAPAPVLVVLE